MFHWNVKKNATLFFRNHETGEKEAFSLSDREELYKMKEPIKGPLARIILELMRFAEKSKEIKPPKRDEWGRIEGAVHL